MIRLGVDTGGTFTDFVLLDQGGCLRVHKVLSTPAAPEEAILRGIAELGLEGEGLQLVHGSTVATNAVLEGKGARTLYIGNRGFADLLTIGRQRRAQLYELQPPPLAPPVAAELCLETGGRVDAHGNMLEPLDDAELAALAARVRALAPEAVAVNLLFSYLAPDCEERIARVMPPGVFVALSSQVLPEIREYERGMATWLNAWVGPPVAGYLERLQRALPGARVAVMQSSGDSVDAAQAVGHAVRMLLSGPAGGLIAARHVGAGSGRTALLTFDMGGTSTDVALIDGEPRLTGDGRIGPYPVAVPMVDMHTIGAGGGSIAWLDPGGMLQVGPQSAGAEPGPACYGLGGTRPTVSDANLVLGRLQPAAFLGGRMGLDKAAAHAAVGRLAAAMGLDPVQAAREIVAVANEHMAQALRAISIRRGEDPRDFVLVSFGGAGGLHVCALAELLEMHSALVPQHAGVLSALGMLAARPGRQLSHSRVELLSRVSAMQMNEGFAGLADQGLAALAAEGLGPEVCELRPSVDLRYAGQAYTLNLPWLGHAATEAAFHRRHRERYGHRLELPVELVNLRLQVRGPDSGLRLPPLAQRPPAEPFMHAAVDGVQSPVPQFRREELAPGQRLRGPALITEPVATTWLPAHWQLEVDPVGHLVLSRLV
jgi:N-methylhydantoinase A